MNGRNGGECRCLRRSDLMKTLAEELPPNTVRLGCKVVSIKVDANTSAYSILHLHDGTMLMPRVYKYFIYALGSIFDLSDPSYKGGCMHAGYNWM